MLVYPKLNPLSLKEINITEFTGIDKRWNADEKTLFHSQNISAFALPALVTRNGRKKVFSAPSGERITGIFSFDKAYVTTVLAGVTRLYSGDDLSSLSLIYKAGTEDTATSLICKAGGNICLFNTRHEGEGSNMLVAHNGDFTQTERVSTPHFNDAVIYKNRLFGCGRWRIFASAYNEITNWNMNEERIDIEARAFEKSIKCESDFTACTTYKGHALFFTADELYKLGGKDNSNFELVKIANYGCVNRGALCESGGILYFVSKDGIVGYDGSRVWLALDKLCGKETDSTKTILCGKGKGLYLNTTTQDGSCLYGFNTEAEGYVREDDFAGSCAVRHNGNVFFADNTDIYKFDVLYSEDAEGNDVRNLEWQVITQDICDFLPRNKRSSKLEIGAYMPFDNLIEVFVSYDGGDYEITHTISGVGYKDVCIPLTRANYNSVRFKLGGLGEAQIYYMRFACNVGTEEK
ncbi:MAG: hypothetical protein E7539_05970 [Ruminococcaceae bacterium]|nr:hypothetical protein [Oscillospiraceae bacterium]